MSRLAAVLLLLGAMPALAQEPPRADPVFELSPRAYVQFDWRGYPDWNVPTGSGRLNHDALEVRRARLGVDGRWRRVSFELTVDPQDYDGVLVKDAYAQVRVSRKIRVRVGQFKIPGSREYATSARSTDFMERAALADAMAAGRDMGGMVAGEIGSRLSYQGGVFVGDGNGRRSRSGATGASRVEFALAKDVDLGGSFSLGRTEAIDTEDPNGLIGRAASGYRFFEQVYVNGWRVRSGADVAWSRGPWRLTLELMRADEQRVEQGLDYEDLPREVGTGWSLALTREVGRPNGGSRLRWREFDLGLRLDSLSFDDIGPSTDSDSVRARATDIRPRSVLASTAGVSWRPTTWTRVLAGASWERYAETRSGPAPGRTGFLSLGSRLQVMLP